MTYGYWCSLGSKISSNIKSNRSIQRRCMIRWLYIKFMKNFNKLNLKSIAAMTYLVSSIANGSFFKSDETVNQKDHWDTHYFHMIMTIIISIFVASTEITSINILNLIIYNTDNFLEWCWLILDLTKKEMQIPLFFRFTSFITYIYFSQ